MSRAGGEWGVHFTAEQINSPDFGVSEEFHRWNAGQVRRLAEQKLRPRLRWLVDHPRLLGWVYRLAPSWRPTVNVFTGTTADR